MRVAILANDAASFFKPMADGLDRMLQNVGAEASVYYRGHYFLNFETLFHSPHPFKRLVKQQVLRRVRRRDFSAFARELSTYDLIVVVAHVPMAFARDNYPEIETLRQINLHIPIVLYDLVYLPTRGKWYEYLRDGSPNHGLKSNNFGMERYDWYLAVSVVSECPLPAGDNPVNVIGINLDDGLLYPDQCGFQAVLDFERPHAKERTVQIRALEETSTPYTILEGAYSREAICGIYRTTALYFVAHRESFGLPICELQACGSYVATPYSNWVPSHWIKDPRQPGEGRLSNNFIVYNNDLELLKHEIERVKRGYDANRVRQTFLTEQPQYYYGDSSAAASFLQHYEMGAIHAGSHNGNSEINDRIVTAI